MVFISTLVILIYKKSLDLKEASTGTLICCLKPKSLLGKLLKDLC